MSTLRILLLSSACLSLPSCAEDWDYFWNGDNSPYAPRNSGYSSGYSSPSYSPSYTPAPSYSDVESQDQKMRNYRQDLDRKINDAVY